MKLRAFFLLAAVSGSITLACSGPDETIIVYLPPPQDASTPLVEDLPADEADIPCAPRRVLQTICQQCHTQPAQNGAPFPLINRSDIVTRTYGGVVVREAMIEEVSAGRMPLSPVTITNDDKATLLGWLRGGAPADPNVACDAGSGDKNDAE